MTTENVLFDLNEAHIHLGELVKGLTTGRISAEDFGPHSVELNHVMDHLCRAWNTKYLTPEQKQLLSQEEFERASNTVPNLMGERIVGDFNIK